VGRAFVPFAAGLSEMSAGRFMSMAVIAGVLWAGAVVALGYVLGSNWRLVERWLQSFGAGVLIVFGLTIAMVLLWRWLAARQSEITAAWQRHVARRLSADLMPFVDFVRARFSPTGYLGLHLTAGLIAIGALAWLFGGIAQDIFAQDPLVHIDRGVAIFLAQRRTPALDGVMAVPAFLSDPRWLVLLVAVAAIGSALTGEWTLSITAAPILGGAYGLAFGLQAIFSKFSPHAAPPELVHGFLGFPSVTLTVATSTYGMACYSLIVHIRSWRLQTFSVIVGLYVIILIGLGALYTGELLSSTIGGFALGACWLAICLTGSLTFDRIRSSSRPMVTPGQRAC
jgi:hypothetical protein